MTMVSADRLAEVLVEVADTLVDEFDLIEFLQMVTTHTTELAQADAAGILLADHRGRLRLTAATDERAKMLELFQIQANEGPCFDCFRLGDAVSHPDLTESDSWPSFAARAVAVGFVSVHAFPMRLRQNVIGTLNLLSSEVGTMPSTDMRVVQALADVATIGLLQEQAIRRGEVLTEQLQVALHSRIAIEQAKGVVAQIHGVTPDDAFEMMREFSRRHRQKLGEVAQLLLEDPASLPELSTPRGS